MKKRIPTRVLSAFLAFVMVFLMMPIVANAESTSNTYATNDYTPFLIETANGKAVYNASTADMSYDFYLAARSYIDNYAGNNLYPVQDGAFSFGYNGNTYTPESVFFSKPQEYPSCGLLTGVLNYEVGNSVKHIVLVAFRGSDKIEDWITDAAVVTGDDGYHEGFEETAQKHYEAMTNTVEYSLGNGESISFSDFLVEMKSGNDDYTMIVTGHSLGAGVAGVFTSKYLDNKNNITSTNAVTYTFASPLTCSDDQATKEADTVKNVFNIVNTDDIVTKVGANVSSGERTGYDLKWKLGKYGSLVQNWKGFYENMFDLSKFLKQYKKTFSGIGDNHHMGTAYLPTKNHINSHINEYTSAFVLYNNYDEATHIYQRIVFNNGQLIVSGSGVLDGNWTENTLVEWAKVKNDCTSLVFDTDCKITEIGDYAFAGMSQLTNELDLPETVTKIGNYAFFHCGFNGDLIILAGMKEIGISAFNGCSKLDSINAQAATGMTWGYGAFANCVGQHDLLLPVEDSGTDLAKIFKTYYVQDSNGSYLIDVDDATSGNIVLPGDKIYIGRIEDDKLNVRPYYDFHYLLTKGHTDTADNIQTLATNTIANVASVDESGCITVSGNCQSGTEFTVVVMDNYKGNPDYDVYDSNRFIHFTVGTINDKFAGGVGTEERPYLIKNYDQLTRIKDDLSACYKLMANINCTNETAWTSLGSSSSAFTGSIDGNGYTISNLTGSGFIAYNAGTIKNVHFHKANMNDNAGMWEGGIIANINMNTGNIINCSITESNRSLSYSGTGAEIHLKVGGVCGENLGTISHCEIIKSTITGYSSTSYDSNYYNVVGYSGALAGVINKGEVRDCYVYSNAISLTLKHRVYDKAVGAGTKTYAYFRMGGIAGECRESNLVRIIAENNTVNSPDHQWDETGKGNDINPSKLYYEEKTAFIGLKTAQSDYYVNCYCDAYNDTYIQEYTQFETNQNLFIDNEWRIEKDNISPYIITTGIEIFSNPSKLTYYIGESLNLYGLVVRDNNNNLINGYTISGFDSNKSGSQTLTITYITGYGTFTDNFNVTVENIIPQTVVVQPKDDRYDIKNALSIDDFIATIYYNNGTTEIMESLAENVSDIVKFTAFSNLLDTKDTQVLQLNYHYAYMTVDGKATASTSIVAYVAVTVNCDCLSTTTLNAMPATVSEYGYTGDLVCSTCQSIVEEGSIVNMLECTDHNYGVWENHDETQHSRVCACGEVEYATHNWNSGAITKPATHLAAGELTKTCSDCSATKIETIDPITNHSFGSWKVHDENQHIRTCECGEKEYADHAWNDGVVTTEPTHLASGEKTYTCTECTATKTEDIPPIEGHTFGKWTKHDDAQHVCSCQCGETDYADHEWDDGTITTPATYEQDGVRTHSCLDCEATYTVAIPKPVSVHLFVVDDASAVPGGTMQVNVRLENNPGIAMMRLKISYDSSVLDLEQVNYNTEIGGTATQPTIYDGYVTLLWYNDSENVEGDWIFATLTFTVKDTAPVGSVSDIVLTYDAEEVCDIEENNIVFSIDNGVATVLDHVPGDINGDDGLTSKDLLRLARYFAGWDVEVNENALDINGDGNVNSKDLLRLARYLAGWDVEIH